MDFAELKRMKDLLDRLLEEGEASESSTPPLTQNDPKPTDGLSSPLTPNSYEESPKTPRKTPNGSEETSEAQEIFEPCEAKPEQKNKKLRSQKQMAAFEKCRALRWKARKKEKELFDRWSEPDNCEDEPETSNGDYYLPVDDIMGNRHEALQVKVPPRLMRGIG